MFPNGSKLGVAAVQTSGPASEQSNASWHGAVQYPPGRETSHLNRESYFPQSKSVWHGPPVRGGQAGHPASAELSNVSQVACWSAVATQVVWAARLGQ
jgi:hypothetical protein